VTALQKFFSHTIDEVDIQETEFSLIMSE